MPLTRYVILDRNDGARTIFQRQDGEWVKADEVRAWLEKKREMLPYPDRGTAYKVLFYRECLDELLQEIAP